MRWSGVYQARLSWTKLGRHAITSLPRREARFASDSAVKHIFSRTTTVADLYAVHNADHTLPSELALRNLARAGNFTAADQIRLHLIREGVEIEPHPIYEQAAMLCLPWTDVDDDRVSSFEAWFSLIPQRQLAKRYYSPLLERDVDPFPVTRRFLFASPSTRFPVILRFGVIAASKGYIQPMLRDTLPLLIRFASEDVATAWFRDMEHAIAQYSSQFHTAPRYRHMSTAVNRFRQLSVNVCYKAGWLSHAMAILKANPDLYLSDANRAGLIKALRDAGRMADAATVVQRVQAPRLQVASRHFEETPLLPEHPSQLKPRSERHSVAVDLRSFIGRIRNRQAISTSDIAAFLSCLRKVGGNPHTMARLRQCALSAGPHCALPWLNAELKYYYTEQKYNEVLKLYLSYFDTDLPLPDLFPDALSRIASHHQYSTAPKSLKCGLPKHRLVLDSIIHLVPTLPESVETLRALYESYRQVVDKAEGHHTLAAFMYSFGECAAPDDAVRILEADQEASGKPPNLKMVVTLAGVLARTGHVEKAMAMLEKIEAGEMRVMLPVGRPSFLRPSPRLYRVLLNGFIDASLLEPALKVEAMMRRTFRRGNGRNRRDVETINALRTLEAELATV
ncbi:hypothetical protein DXG01_002715 [Tephrocybe rancida]|nr:hypothetical protein DXG01_002715 [Tephrocybe rancida]